MMADAATLLQAGQSLLLWLGGAVLLLYPMAALASLMALGSKNNIPLPWFNRCCNRLFHWGCLLYPLLYGGCYFWLQRQPGLFPAALPLLYLALLAGCFRFMDAPAK